jgi:hypothetical protein
MLVRIGTCQTSCKISHFEAAILKRVLAHSYLISLRSTLGKIQVTSMHAMTAYGTSVGTASLVLKIRTRCGCVVRFQPRPLNPGRTTTGAPCPCRKMNYVSLFPTPYRPQKMTLETAHVLQHQKGKSDKRIRRSEVLNTLNK